MSKRRTGNPQTLAQRARIETMRMDVSERAVDRGEVAENEVAADIREKVKERRRQRGKPPGPIGQP